MTKGHVNRTHDIKCGCSPSTTLNRLARLCCHNRSLTCYQASSFEQNWGGDSHAPAWPSLSFIVRWLVLASVGHKINYEKTSRAAYSFFPSPADSCTIHDYVFAACPGGFWCCAAVCWAVRARHATQGLRYLRGWVCILQCFASLREGRGLDELPLNMRQQKNKTQGVVLLVFYTILPCRWITSPLPWSPHACG